VEQAAFAGQRSREHTVAAIEPEHAVRDDGKAGRVGPIALCLAVPPETRQYHSIGGCLQPVLEASDIFAQERKLCTQLVRELPDHSLLRIRVSVPRMTVDHLHIADDIGQFHSGEGSAGKEVARRKGLHLALCGKPAQCIHHPGRPRHGVGRRLQARLAGCAGRAAHEVGSSPQQCREQGVPNDLLHPTARRSSARHRTGQRLRSRHGCRAGRAAVRGRCLSARRQSGLPRSCPQPYRARNPRP